MKDISYKLFFLTVFIAITIFIGCKKEEPIPINEDIDKKASATTLKVNNFITDAMSDVYLWYNYLPRIDAKYETDSKAYFKKLLYKEDKWSFITDNVAELENSMNGIEKTFGYSLAFGSFVDDRGIATGNYFAIVEYLYPNSPASRAGFERGSIITQLNGSSITKNNYYDLLSGESISVTTGTLTTSGISNTGTVTMVAEDLNLDPVIVYKIIEKDGHKIGYLFYAQFIASHNASIQTAFDYFKTNQITDLVVDLRYNPGGQHPAAQYLCSSIAPLSVVDNNKTLVTLHWNERYQKLYTEREQTVIPFLSSVPTKLGMNNVTILTGPGTASASELTITGLKPYMNVVMVGDTTYGKYTGSWTIKPEDIYSNVSQSAPINNWGIQPIVMRFANSQGVTNFVNGFAPDHFVFDQLLPAHPLGDISDPLLNKAVETITGNPILALKSTEVPKFHFKVFDRGFSKFDPFKRNSPLDFNMKFINRNRENP